MPYEEVFPNRTESERLEDIQEAVAGVCKSRLAQEDRRDVGEAEAWCGGRKRSR